MTFLNELLGNLDFFSLMGYLFDNQYYKYIFPFLLTYALMTAILPIIELFKGGKKKPIVVILSLGISFFAVAFPLGDNGLTLGDFMMMLFPNISAISIGILGLYVIGSIIGKDFFRGIANRGYSAYIMLAIMIIGFGSVIYYFGIATGWWSDYGVSQLLYWNVILGLAFGILGLVFLFVDGFQGLGIVFLLIFMAFIYNYGDGNMILSYFKDPVIFISLIIVGLVSYMNRLPPEEQVLKLIKEYEKSKSDFEKEHKTLYAEKTPQGKHLMHDIMYQNLIDKYDKIKGLIKKHNLKDKIQMPVDMVRY